MLSVAESASCHRPWAPSSVCHSGEAERVQLARHEV